MRDARDRRLSRFSALPGWSQGATWRVDALLALGLLAVGLALMWTGALAGATIISVLVPPLSFLAGYCYRQHVVNRSRLPRLRALWLLEDLRQSAGASTDAELGGERPGEDA